MATFKTRLFELMKEKNLTQLEVAEIAKTTQATLSRNINGVHAPKAETVESIASFFNVSTDYLLGISDDRKPQTIKEQLKGVKLALYNQTEELTDSQAQDVLKYIEFIKSKDSE